MYCLSLDLPHLIRFTENTSKADTAQTENKLDSKLRNENYCKATFGTRAAQVIMDGIDSSKRK